MATMATTTAHAPVAVATEAVEVPPGPIYVDTQHEDLVHDTRMDYYGAKLATCSSGTFIFCMACCVLLALLLVKVPIFSSHSLSTSHSYLSYLSSLYRPHRQGL